VDRVRGLALDHLLLDGARRLLAGRLRVLQEDLAAAALERAQGLAASGHRQPLGERGRLAELRQVPARVQPGGLDDVLGVRRAEPVGPHDATDQRVQAPHERIPCALVARHGGTRQAGDDVLIRRGHGYDRSASGRSNRLSRTRRRCASCTRALIGRSGVAARARSCASRRAISGLMNVTIPVSNPLGGRTG
jgi:hypothetical protein